MGTRAPPRPSRNRGPYLGALDAEPVTGWPAAVEQLTQAEEDAAKLREAFVAHCDSLPERHRGLREEREAGSDAARQLRDMLG